MAERHRQEGPLPGPEYALELRKYPDRTDVAIIRPESVLDAADVHADVWLRSFPNASTARTTFDVMRARCERWASWALMAVILGPEFVAEQVEAEVIAAREKQAEQAEKESRHADDARKAEEAARHVSLELHLAKSDPRILALRGKSRFMTLRLDTVVEARRVWDWIRWQRPAFDDWYALCEKSGPVALEKFVLDSMLLQEKRVRASGLSAGGRRPLRYWRPETKVEGSDADEEGSGS